MNKTRVVKALEAIEGVVAEGSKVFCPTGPGGGVDPTCSPGGSAGVPGASGGSGDSVAMIFGDAAEANRIAARLLRGLGKAAPAKRPKGSGAPKNAAELNKLLGEVQDF